MFQEYVKKNKNEVDVVIIIIFVVLADLSWTHIVTLVILSEIKKRRRPY